MAVVGVPLLILFKILIELARVRRGRTRRVQQTGGVGLGGRWVLYVYATPSVRLTLTGVVSRAVTQCDL